MKFLVCYSREQQVVVMEWHNDISLVTVIVTSTSHQKIFKRSRSVYTCTYTHIHFTHDYISLMCLVFNFLSKGRNIQLVTVESDEAVSSEPTGT